MKNNWDFDDIVTKIIQFRDDRDWRQYHYPKDLAAALSIEVAELQEIFLWKGQEPSQDIISDHEKMENIRDEIADVAIYLLLLANELEIDLRDSIEKKIIKNELKYPIFLQ